MKRKTLLLLFVSTLSAFVVGCSKRSKDPQPDLTNYADKIVGTFKGAAIYDGSAAEIITKTIVKATGDNVVEITILDYKVSETLKVDLLLGGVKVAKVDEKSLSLSAVSTTTVEGKTVDVNISGSALMSGESLKIDASISGYSGIKYSGNRYTNATGAELMTPVISGVCVISSQFDAEKGIITYKVPAHALDVDLESVEATFTISDGASWTSKEGAQGVTKASETQKLTLKKAETTIEVTAENGDKKSYTFKRESVVVEDVSVSLVNTYEGDISVVVGPGTPEKIEDQNVSVIRTGANSVQLTVKNLSFGGASLGDIVIKNVALYKGENEIAMSGLDKIKIKIGDNELEVDANLKGVYSITKKSITLNIDIVVDENLSVKVDFEGVPFIDPIATKPLFVSVSHPKILLQNFDDNGSLKFYVNSKYPDEDFADLEFEIKLPEGATYKVTSTPEFDFTQKTQWYTVTAADGATTKNYSIERVPLEFINTTKFDFTEWTKTENEAPNIDMFDPKGWQTPNIAVNMIKATTGGSMYPFDGAFPVNPIDGGKEGKAAEIVTLDTKGGEMWEGGPKVPKVTSGTIYTGAFNILAAMGNPLEATEFGLLYDGAKPTKLTGWYTYTPGSIYYDGTTVTAAVDEPVMSIILYDVTDDVKATITGVDTYTSERIIGMGKINPAKSEAFREFTVDMVYTKEYTPATRVYKLAMILSSSKDGALFKGAPGSRLVVDELNIVTE